MAQVRVHNISDRPNSPSQARAFRVAGQVVRPGKSVSVEDSMLSSKFKKLHGSSVWIGDQVPRKFKATSKSALRSLQADIPPMTIEQAREYLASLKKEELLGLCGQLSPALSFTKEPSQRMLVVKLARACFSGTKVLDPESFFWLRRWTKKGNTFIERA
jgi:hypothetical protein